MANPKNTIQLDEWQKNMVQSHAFPVPSDIEDDVKEQAIEKFALDPKRWFDNPALIRSAKGGGGIQKVSETERNLAAQLLAYKAHMMGLYNATVIAKNENYELKAVNRSQETSIKKLKKNTKEAKQLQASRSEKMAKRENIELKEQVAELKAALALAKDEQETMANQFEDFRKMTPEQQAAFNDAVAAAMEDDEDDEDQEVPIKNEEPAEEKQDATMADEVKEVQPAFKMVEVIDLTL